MGSFKGHALPGSFFLLAGVWWTVKHSLCFSSRRNKSLRTSSRVAQRRLEVFEGSAVLLCSVVGMLLEQFAAQGPALQLLDSSQHHWVFLMNWQHSTMYLFFSLWAAVSLIVQSSEAAPLALDRLMLAVAFFNEGFLFLYHLHGRSPLDVHLHQLLLFCVFGLALLCFLEVFQRGNLVLELLRCTLTLLQGSWFWQIGFVLYSPHGQVWDQSDHNNVMFVTMCFSWHLAVAMVTVSGIYAAVTCVVRSRLRRTPPMEMGLLKPRDREPESEDEIL
ncbi:transmembrane protein 45A [Trematomus bernacchii]|uniref:Transmembrane protein 45a n=1 Tax=Pagothenia borchgrevinki TaxID=8213 RepID=A0ABD2G2T0_PAGBO|nr:transmembrane protein 45A [Trematomus bernacchii]